MVRIYLDHNHWVSLARAQVGHPDGARFHDVHQRLAELVAEKAIVLPLSATHFLEVAGTSSDRRRSDMATAMIGLSQNAVLAPFTVAFPVEADNAVRRSAGLRVRDVRAEVLGSGVSFALGERAVISDAPPALAAELIGAIESQETARLVMGASSDEYRERSRRVDEEGARSINATRAMARAARATKAQLLEHNQRDFMKHQYIPALAEALGAHGLDNPGGMARLRDPKPGLLEVMMACPSVDVWIGTSVERDFDWDRAVTGNDFRDQAFLAVAVPYCDIVVTERYFGGVLERSSLADRHRCRVLTSLLDLPETLRQLA